MGYEVAERPGRQCHLTTAAGVRAGAEEFGGDVVTEENAPGGAEREQDE
jgi:hypothetical protein